jgi:hypothetical protein
VGSLPRRTVRGDRVDPAGSSRWWTDRHNGLCKRGFSNKVIERAARRLKADNGFEPIDPRAFGLTKAAYSVNETLGVLSVGRMSLYKLVKGGGQAWQKDIIHRA